MNREEAIALAKTLHHRIQSKTLTASVVGDRIYFEGGRQGGHSLAYDVSTAERVQAHWAGYCENNRKVPVVGDIVTFPSGSSRTGLRRGRVTKVGPKRVTVVFRYKHGGMAAPKSVPIDDLRI